MSYCYACVFCRPDLFDPKEEHYRYLNIALSCLGDHNMGMTARKAAEVLNEMLALDYGATSLLVGNRVPCGEKLFDHPSVQVAVLHGVPMVGLLGVINGILMRGQSTGEVVAAVYLDDKLVRFETTVPKWGTND